MNDLIRVFVGSTEEHSLAVKVLAHTIKSNTTADVEVTPLCESLIPIPEAKDPKNRGVTAFSFQRFLIPEICGYQGRGIYLDSDMIAFGNIREVWCHDMRGAKVCCTPGWQTAVMLIDNTVGWSINVLISSLDSGTLSYKDLMNLRAVATMERTLPAQWNCHDREKPQNEGTLRPDARLLHYTNMATQPWLKAGHRLEKYWIESLHSAISAGAVTTDDVMQAVELGHVRPSLASEVGHTPPKLDCEFVFPDDLRKVVL